MEPNFVKVLCSRLSQSFLKDACQSRLINDNGRSEWFSPSSARFECLVAQQSAYALLTVRSMKQATLYTWHIDKSVEWQLNSLARTWV